MMKVVAGLKQFDGTETEQDEIRFGGLEISIDSSWLKRC